MCVKLSRFSYVFSVYGVFYQSLCCDYDRFVHFVTNNEALLHTAIINHIRFALSVKIVFNRAISLRTALKV